MWKVSRDGRVWYDPPDGYPVLCWCTSCGRDFAGDSAFDEHRGGSYESGRRCLDDDELRRKGMRPLRDDELRASGRDRRRAGFGVEMWVLERAGGYRQAPPARPTASRL